jgi:hypothetical protein
MYCLDHETGFGFLVVQASSLRPFTLTVRPRVLSSRGPFRQPLFLFRRLRGMASLLSN